MPQVVNGFLPHYRQPSNKVQTMQPAQSFSNLQAVHTLRGGAIHIKKVETAMSSNNFLRGKLMILVHKIFVSPKIYAEIFWDKILPMTYWPEVALILIMSNSLSLSKWIYSLRPSTKGLDDEAWKAAYKKSKQFKIARVSSQIGYLQALLYISDVILVTLKFLQFDFVAKYKAQRIAGPIIFSAWLAYNTSRLKYYWLKHGLSLRKVRYDKPVVDPNGQPVSVDATTLQVGEPPRTVSGYNRFINRILDIMIWGCALISVIESMGLQLSFALKSVFGLGSFGTLVLSLASKDLASEFVGGLMIQSSNFFEEGENVVMSDGSRGKVLKIGWLVSFYFIAGFCIAWEILSS